jgi:hypothetical protein
MLGFISVNWMISELKVGVVLMGKGSNGGHNLVRKTKPMYVYIKPFFLHILIL